MQSTQSTEFSTTGEGDLRIGLTVQGQIELERLLTRHADWSDEDIFIELIDYQLARGWYIISLNQVRSQSPSLMLTESFDEDGNLIATGLIYWYPQYETEPYAAALVKNGHIVFQKGN
jgi:hypothetical protein